MSAQLISRRLVGNLAAGFVSLVGLMTDPRASTADEPQYQLQYRFQPNQFVYYEVTQAMTITAETGSYKNTARHDAQTIKHFRVLSVDESRQATIEAVIDQTRMEARFSEGDPPVESPAVLFDSTSGQPAPQQFQSVEAAIGKPTVRMLVSATGELLKVQNLQTASPNGAPAIDDQNAKNFLIILPASPVKVGDVWKDKITVPVTVSPGLHQPITLQRQYTLAEVRGSIAVLELKTSVLTPVNDSRLEAQLIQRTPRGKIEFDMERGLILSQNLTIQGESLNAGGNSVKLKAASQSTEKLLENPPKLASNAAGR